jgi:hypothetical protein
MDSSHVNRELRAVVRPALQTHGFSAFTSRTAWRYREGRIDVVNFQSFNDYLATGVGCTTFSFTLNLGIYLLDQPPPGRPLREKGGQARPEEWLCHLRFHPHRTLEQPELGRRDIWYLDPGGRYLEAAVRDARTVILEVGLAWFDRLSTDAVIFALLMSDRDIGEDGTELPGRPGAPVRNLVAGYLAQRMGRFVDAHRLLARALEQYRAMDDSFSTHGSRVPRQPMIPASLAQDVARLNATA